MSKNGSIDEDGGTFKFSNLEDESDCEDGDQKHFKKNQFSAKIEGGYDGVKKELSNEERDNYVLNDVPNSKDDKVESNVKKESPFNSSKNDTGEWLLNGKKILIVSVYAPQELCEKKMLWDYLILVLNNWNGEVVIMGDFNEVRTQKERYESIFNIQGADAFNLLFLLWYGGDGFDNFVEQKWKNSQVTDMNAMSKLMKKLKFLKEQIRMWIKANKDKSKNNKQDLKADLNKIDLMLDKGDGNSDILSKHMDVIKSLQERLRKQFSDCGVDKSPGPDGFTFGFYRRYWSFMENDVVEAVLHFFHFGKFPKGDIVNDVQSAFVDFEKAYDSVRWDYLEDILKKIGFGEKWCDWICNCLLSSKGSIIVNGSPTNEFRFQRGLKQGIKLGNSLQMSHQFYADDAIFMGHWSDSNLDTLLRVLDCFYHASGLHINMIKSKLMGISVPSAKVDEATNKIGCATLKVPFTYLGLKVGCLMSRTQSWNDIVNNILTRLSRWKLKTLSIGEGYPSQSALVRLPIISYVLHSMFQGKF
ncbi:RNA-directed DNA polymerase, eukaryota [Tanacetum coccineum]